jgi:hypothetical protein
MTDSAGKGIGWIPPQPIRHEFIHETFKHDAYDLPPVELPYVGRFRAFLRGLRLRFFPYELRRIDE